MRKLELFNPCDFTPEYGVPTADPDVLLCRGCGHTVRDLSAMTEAEALAFLERRRPDECVQFRTDASERVRFADGTGSLIDVATADTAHAATTAPPPPAASGAEPESVTPPFPGPRPPPRWRKGTPAPATTSTSRPLDDRTVGR